MVLALAAPEVIGFIVLALLLVILLVNAQLYQNGRQARSFAVNLPVVAGPVVSAIDWLIGFDIQAARAIDSQLSAWLVASTQAFGRLVVVAFNAAGAAILALIHHTAAAASSALTLATHLSTAVIPALESRVASLERLEGSVSAVVRAAIAAAVAVAVAGLESELAGVRQQATSTQQQLDTYRPLLNSLAAIPGGAAALLLSEASTVATLTARVGVLERELGQAESGVTALERTIAAQAATLAQLAALGILAGAGAAVIENLLRLARDPCYCLTQGAFSDLPGRVASLELGNL